MDHIKEAFTRVKDDMDSLKLEINSLREEIREIQTSILQLFDALGNLEKSPKTQPSTHPNQNPTLRHINKTEIDNSTHKLPFKSLKEQKIDISSGNQGVSTDRQTDRQTDTSTGNKGVISREIPSTSIILDQLDEIKKELRLKIKKLTNQEMLVLSSIYQFEDQGYLVDYQLLSQSLNLTESSIRDYVQRITNKGVSLEKERINNKKIIIHIPSDLRKLASLSTLVALREL